MSEHEVGFKHMAIEQLHGMLGDEAPVIVDIRDPASFQANRIPGAIHLTNDNISDFLREADLDAPTVVCCYHGISSQQAAQFFSWSGLQRGLFIRWWALRNGKRNILRILKINAHTVTTISKNSTT